MDNRIKQLRKELGLTQQEFADGMKVPRNNIAGYETSKRNPSEAAFKLICNTYGVSEEWLKNGKGEMFKDVSREQEITNYLGDLVSSDDNSLDFQKRFIKALSKLSLQDWKVIERLIDDTQPEKKD